MKRNISFGSEIKSFFDFCKILKKEKPDVLHLNSPKASGLGALAGRILGVSNIIFTAHGWTFNEDRNPISKVMIMFFSWITVILCHKVIVIAEREKKQALAMPFVSENKIIFIKNGLENIEFKEKETARKEILEKINKNIEEKTIWIGTISELHKNKGLEYAVSALTKIKMPFIFCIIGDGEERKSLERLIKENGLEDKVFLLGFITEAQIYLKAFDIFTLTSIKEGLPYCILEAGLVSLPVIASNTGGIPDIIENGQSGILVTKEKMGEITRAIEYLVENPDKQKTFGENLKQKVQKEFSIEKMMEKTINLYTH